MKIILITIYILMLWYLFRLKNKVYFHNTLTTSILLLTIIQSPLFYFYTTGMLGFLEIVFYSTVGFGLTILLLVIFKRNTATKTKYHIYGLYIAIIFGFISFFGGPRIVEYLDWNLRKNIRKEIVLKAAKYPCGSHKYIPTEWNFLPISNGGNEVFIDKSKGGILNVEFFIDRGFLDHYSSFVYTNNPESIKYYETSHFAKKIEKNWYRISQ